MPPHHYLSLKVIQAAFYREGNRFAIGVHPTVNPWEVASGPVPRYRCDAPMTIKETVLSDQPIPDICDYEGSNYRTEFWEGRGRDYEDRAERVALGRLLPRPRGRFLELGAGFGRLTPLYQGYEQVVVLDYSASQLEYARQQYGDDGYIYVAANIYEMPFAPGLFDASVMVRVLHHMESPLDALVSIRRVMTSGGIFLMEFANKQNLKAILRWLLRHQDWNPFTTEPVEFVELNFDFHPRFVRHTLKEAGFETGRWLTVSHLRVGFLKRVVPTGLLVAIDSALQLTAPLVVVSPSVFTRNKAVGPDDAGPDGAFWRCPACGGYDLTEDEHGVDCACGKHWPKQKGVYIFKDMD